MAESRIFHKTITCLPIIWLLLFALLVFRAYLQVGHLPTYSQPDPIDIGIGLHYAICFGGLYFTVMLSPIFWIIGFTVVSIKQSKKMMVTDAVIYLSGYVILLYGTLHDLWGFKDWFAD